MSVSELEDALSASDGCDTYRRLHAFATRDGTFTDDIPASTTTRYLRAFCDSTLHYERRRWVGLVLHRLIASSAAVRQTFNAHSQMLVRLGEIVLHKDELEETRIMAGLLIGEALVQGFAFAAFWPSDKVPTSEPRFPQKYTNGWMDAFQKFLDASEDLKVTECPNDLGIFYPVALSASDGFRWAEAVVPVAVVQNGLLTIITLESSMQRFNFIDLPLKNIQSVYVRKSILHDSQGRSNALEPWDTLAFLRPGNRTYLFNATKRSAEEFSMMFENKDEASDCWQALKEIFLQETSQTSSSQTSAVGQDQFHSKHQSHEGNLRQPQRTVALKTLPQG
jgi:hypothetical protein